MTTNGNGYAKKFHLYATAAATIVAMLISLFSYMREMKDEQARAQTGQGLNEQQETIAALRESVEFNRKLLLQLYFATRSTDVPNERRNDSPGISPAPRPRQPPETRRDDNVPPVPKLIPPDKLFKNVPQIPKQEKRDWKNYEQRQLQ